MLNYPLKFNPIPKEKIWGGKKLTEVLHKTSDKEKLGESWEISGLENNVSVVANGVLKGRSLEDLQTEFQGRFLGESLYSIFKSKFPLLIKFIDAQTELSVQLHPNDQLARDRHDSFGKTEMWYILQADEGAEINVGFKRTFTKEEYLEYLNSGRITEILNFEKVKKGDAFFIKPGTVHAIGAGVLLAEIQQTSDITYRIFDWNRKDENGRERELHTELALEAIEFEHKEDFKRSYLRTPNSSNVIAECEYFTTNFLPVSGGTLIKDYSGLDSFVIYMCVGGQAVISVNGNSEDLQTGETVLIPAENSEVLISSEGAELLEIFIQP